MGAEETKERKQKSEMIIITKMCFGVAWLSLSS